MAPPSTPRASEGLRFLVGIAATSRPQQQRSHPSAAGVGDRAIWRVFSGLHHRTAADVCDVGVVLEELCNRLHFFPLTSFTFFDTTSSVHVWSSLQHFIYLNACVDRAKSYRPSPTRQH